MHSYYLLGPGDLEALYSTAGKGQIVSSAN